MSCKTITLFFIGKFTFILAHTLPTAEAVSDTYLKTVRRKFIVVEVPSIHLLGGTEETADVLSRTQSVTEYCR